jgi:hypothetical protein
MPTKLELEQQVKVLKEKLKEVTSELKDSVAMKKDDLGDNPYRALSIFLKDKKYMIARIDYNPENGVTRLVDVSPASKLPEAFHMAKFVFDEAVQVEIIDSMEKRND